MRLDDINRASDLRRAMLAVKQAGSCLASTGAISTVSVQTGSFDGVTGRDHCVEVKLAGTARVELRRVLKQEHERLASSLVELGVAVPPLESLEAKP